MSLRRPRRGNVRSVRTLPEIEESLRRALDALGRARRAELLRTLELPDFDRAAAIGELFGYPATRSLAELAIDAEEDRLVRALHVTMLRERQHGAWRC
jgi:hypothetical protein